VAEQPIPTPFALTILSATPPGNIPRDAVFPGSDRERAIDHPIQCKRLSNANFYRNELITFPVARPGSFSVELRQVQSAYEARRNPPEADARHRRHQHRAARADRRRASAQGLAR
jgi:hypothetical protein